jgi:hypothetical protein
MDLHLRNVDPEIVKGMKIEAATRGVTLTRVAMERLGGKSGANGASEGGGAAKVRRGVGKGSGVGGRKRGAGRDVDGGVSGAGEEGVVEVRPGLCQKCSHPISKHHGFKGACQVDNCVCAGNGNG